MRLNMVQIHKSLVTRNCGVRTLSFSHTNENNEDVELQGVRNSTDDRYYPLGRNDLHGRRQIFTDVKDITAGNLLQVLNKVLPVHLRNRSEEVYLEKYVRGVQPILDRVKQYNDYVCNRTVVNLANEILSFKVAEQAGEPIQYVSRGKDTTVPEKIEELNSLMISEGKQSKDIELAYQVFLYGVGHRLTIQDREEDSSDDYLDEAPFETYTTDSRNTFVVKYNDVAKKPVMGVNYVYIGDDNTRVRYMVYTKNATYTVEGTSQQAEKIVDVKVHNFGMVPIVEYPCNAMYMSPIEVVHDLLNAYSLVLSDRLDGVEQFIQALMVFEGVDISREDFLELKDLGAIKLPPAMEGRQSRVYYLSEQLDQTQTQTLVDDIKQTILEIVGMPSQGNANTSDSSNNGAMIIKNGWWHAEARAMETEGYWKKAETEFLKIVLKICHEDNRLEGLKVSDLETKFGRHSYQDLQTKTQSFSTLIGSNVPPVQAYKYSGLDSDPEAASIQYTKYQEEMAKELEQVPANAKNGQIMGGSAADMTKYRDDYDDWRRRLRARKLVDGDGDGIVGE